MKKKMLSLAICVVLVCGFVPTAAFAEVNESAAQSTQDTFLEQESTWLESQTPTSEPTQESSIEQEATQNEPQTLTAEPTQNSTEEQSGELAAQENTAQSNDSKPVSYLSPVYKLNKLLKEDPTLGLDEMVTQECETYEVVTAATRYFEDGHWYVVKGDVSMSTVSIEVRGTAHLILTDGCNLSVKNIQVNSGKVLNIYGQDRSSGKLTASSDENNAAIGSTKNNDCGAITINGGIVSAQTGTNWGDACSAAIGGGWAGACAEGIIINGGTVTAKAEGKGFDRGAAIGSGGDGGILCIASNIIINGGTVVAHADDNGAAIGGGECSIASYIYVNGGKVDASGSCGAGIGGGWGAEAFSIYISGENAGDTFVDARSENAAGIGGGYKKGGSYITINNAEVRAVSNEGGAAIGGGDGGSGTNISITNKSIVSATAGSERTRDLYCGAGIGGGCKGEGSNITITDSRVTSKGGKRGAGIGGGHAGKGENITISNSWVRAYGNFGGAAIGGGNNSYGLSITIKDNSDVEAYGDYDSAGIGGGEDGFGNLITIENSTVLACGGGKDGGAGIGGGESGGCNTVKIIHSTVKAYGGEDSAGIGGGKNASSAENIFIQDGSHVEAYGGNKRGAGIGGGNKCAGNYITIEGDTTYVKACGGLYGAGIGGGNLATANEININGGHVEAYGGSGGGAGIGGGDEKKASNIHVKGNVDITASSGHNQGDGIGSARKSGGQSSNITIAQDEVELNLFLNGNLTQYGDGDLSGLFCNKKNVRICKKDNIPSTCEHQWSFTADAAMIFAACSSEEHEPNSPEFIELIAPDNLEYDGQVKEATINGWIDGVELPAVKYYKDGVELAGAPTTAGSYVATLTLGDATAQVAFEVTGGSGDDPVPSDNPSSGSSSIPNTGDSFDAFALLLALVLLASSVLGVAAVLRHRLNRE